MIVTCVYEEYYGRSRYVEKDEIADENEEGGANKNLRTVSSYMAKIAEKSLHLHCRTDEIYVNRNEDAEGGQRRYQIIPGVGGRAHDLRAGRKSHDRLRHDDEGIKCDVDAPDYLQLLELLFDVNFGLVYYVHVDVQSL